MSPCDLCKSVQSVQSVWVRASPCGSVQSVRSPCEPCESVQVRAIRVSPCNPCESLLSLAVSPHNLCEATTTSPTQSYVLYRVIVLLQRTYTGCISVRSVLNYLLKGKRKFSSIDRLSHTMRSPQPIYGHVARQLRRQGQNEKMSHMVVRHYILAPYTGRVMAH